MNMINNVCVCVCFWNTNPKYLEECFLSIHNAVWLFKRYYSEIPIEVHVLDDGTTNEETLDMFYNQILQKYDYIKYWKLDYHTNLPTAINSLHKHTPKHSLVIYMDSDDMMIYNRIIVQYEVMTKYKRWKDITLCCTNTCTPNMYNDNLNKISLYSNYTILDSPNQLLKNTICHPSICYKIDDIRCENVKYDENIKWLTDYDFYLNILSHRLKILYITDSLLWWRQYPLSERPDFDRKYSEDLDLLKKKYNIEYLEI